MEVKMAQGAVLDTRACQSNLGKGSLARGWAHQKNQKLGRLIGYFEKAPVKNPGEQRSSSLPSSVTCTCPFVCPCFLAQEHVTMKDLTQSWLCGLQRIKLSYEIETLATGLCFGLAEETVEVFHVG